MDYNKNERINIVKKVIENNGLTPNDLKDVLHSKIANSSSVYRKFNANGISNQTIISCFEPSLEEIDVTSIKGIDFDSNTFLDAILNIYRPESLFENIGNFNINKFNNSLKNSHYTLIEENGKYYVFGDGNHRTLLMLFQYYLELAKLQKVNATKDKFDQLKNKYKIKAPVIHLKHDKNLINSVLTTRELDKNYGGLSEDFINTKKHKDTFVNCLLKYNKQNNTYNIFYKGITKANLDSNSCVNFMKKLNNLDLDNEFFYHNNSFTLYNKHIGINKIPYSSLEFMDQNISEFDLKDIGVDYFIEGDYDKALFSLSFSGKDYGDKKLNTSLINKFINDNNSIFSKRTNKNDEIFSYSNYLEEMRFKNLKMRDVMETIEKVRDLNNLITNIKKKGLH